MQKNSHHKYSIKLNIYMDSQKKKKYIYIYKYKIDPFFQRYEVQLCKYCLSLFILHFFFYTIVII